MFLRLSESILLLLLAEHTSARRHPRDTRIAPEVGNKPGDLASGETVNIPGRNDAESLARGDRVGGTDSPELENSYDTVIPTSNSSETSTQMTNKEAKNALIYVVLFLLLYTSSIGMLILYNVNHHKKVSEHEELKRHEKAYERSQELIELQKRAETYLHYKMLYGHEFDTGTPPVDGPGTPESTPSLSRKSLFPKLLSPSNLQNAFQAKLKNSPLLSTVREYRPGLQKNRPVKFRYRPKRQQSHPPEKDSPEEEDVRSTQTWHPSSLTADEQKMLQQVRKGSTPKESRDSLEPKVIHLKDKGPKQTLPKDDDERSNQTWHPSSITPDEQKMLQKIVKGSSPRGSKDSIEPRVVVLKRNLKKDLKAASAEEMENMITESRESSV